jgi:hypothetical protein
MVSYAASVTRSSMSTFTTSGVIDHISFGAAGFAFDWPNTAPVI